MKKNVFQGFAGKELENSNAVKGGYFYRETYNRSGAQIDEDYVTEAGEVDPFNGGTNTYQGSDYTWENCSG